MVTCSIVHQTTVGSHCAGDAIDVVDSVNSIGSCAHNRVGVSARL